MFDIDQCVPIHILSLKLPERDLSELSTFLKEFQKLN